MDSNLIKEMRQAIKRNELDTVKQLIDNHDGLLQVVTVFGTFLNDAARFGMHDIAKYFIDCGMDVNKKVGMNDETPALTEAAFKGHISIVELLYENGAILDVSSFPANPLFAAIYNGHFEVVRFLVEKGIELNVCYAIGDLDKVDAYEYARQYGQTEIAKYLQNTIQARQ